MLKQVQHDNTTILIGQSRVQHDNTYWADPGSVMTILIGDPEFSIEDNAGFPIVHRC